MVVAVDLFKIGRSVTLKLDGNVELTLFEDKYQVSDKPGTVQGVSFSF